MRQLILILLYILAVVSYSSCGYAGINGPVEQYLKLTENGLAKLVIEGNYDDNSYLEPGLVNEIVGLLEKNQLDRIEIINAHFQGGSLQTILKALRTNRTLVTLELYGNKIDAKDARAIANILLVNPVLTSFNLEYNNISTDGIRSIADVLRANSVLVLLNLEHINIGDEDTLLVADALKINTTLASLCLKIDNIGIKGAKAIADALRVNTALTSLDLGYNHIGTEGTLAIAAALRVNTALMSLDLGYNNIGPEGTRAIAAALQENTTLTSLELGGNKINLESSHAIAAALQRNYFLKKLDIGFRNDVLKELTSAWFDCPLEVIESVIKPYGIGYDRNTLLSEIMNGTLEKEFGEYLDDNVKQLIDEIRALQKEFIEWLTKLNTIPATLTPTGSRVSSAHSSSSSSSSSSQQQKSSEQSTSSHGTITYQASGDKPTKSVDGNNNTQLGEYRNANINNEKTSTRTINIQPNSINNLQILTSGTGKTFSDMDTYLDLEQQLFDIIVAMRWEGNLNDKEKLEALEKEIINSKLPSSKKKVLINRIRAIKHAYSETAHYYISHTQNTFEKKNNNLDFQQLDDLLKNHIIKDPYNIPMAVSGF